MLGGEASTYDVDGIPTDGLAALTTRRSIQARRSSDGHRRSVSGSVPFGHGRRSQDRLIHNYDLERDADQFGLADLDDDEEDGSGDSGRKRTSFDKNLVNGPGVAKPKKSKTLDFDDLPKTSLDGRLRRHGS